MDNIVVRDILLNFINLDKEFEKYNIGCNCNEITIENKTTRKPIVRIVITNCIDNK